MTSETKPLEEIASCFVCMKCGCKGERYFSWDGQCLVCEDGEFDEYDD